MTVPGLKATLSLARKIVDVETFVIRVWTPLQRDDESAQRLRGVAEHIGSGDHDAFRDSDELLAFLAGRLDARPEEAGE